MGIKLHATEALTWDGKERREQGIRKETKSRNERCILKYKKKKMEIKGNKRGRKCYDKRNKDK
jgi:hypothetical protein